MKNKLSSLLLTLGLVLGASQSFAANIPITIADNNTATTWGFNGGPFGAAGEDNETEYGTIRSQDWDMEAFVINGTKLYIIGGYNMQSGAAGSGGSVTPGYLTPGDLFIKVGGSTPGYSPTNNAATTTTNSNYNYTYAVDLTMNVGATGPSAQVYSLDANSTLDTVVYDAFGANPWKYNSGGQLVGSSSLQYQSGLTGAQVLTQRGVTLYGDANNALHNVLEVDLSFLGSIATNTNVWFSYTMECGNDSLKGKYTGGFYRTPDGASSVLLIGLGLAAMGFFGLKARR